MLPSNALELEYRLHSTPAQLHSSFSNSYSILVKEKHPAILFARENTDVLTFKKLASGTLHVHYVAFTYFNQDCYEYTSRVCKKS